MCVVIVATLIVAAPFAYLAAKHHHSGGDPGGSILQSIRTPFESVLPPGAHVAIARFTEPQWTGDCGWSVVFGSETFFTSSTGAEVIAHINDYLTAHGWSRVPDPQGGPTIWIQGTVGGVKRIDLAAHQGATAGSFLLTGAAPPLGLRCGGG